MCAMCQEIAVSGVQKSAVLADFSTSTAENSARRAQKRGKPSGFSRCAELQPNLVKQNSASTADFAPKACAIVRLGAERWGGGEKKHRVATARPPPDGVSFGMGKIRTNP